MPVTNGNIIMQDPSEVTNVAVSDHHRSGIGSKLF